METGRFKRALNVLTVIPSGWVKINSKIRSFVVGPGVEEIIVNGKVKSTSTYKLQPV